MWRRVSTKELCLSRCRKSRPGPFRHPQDSGCFPSESSYLIKSQVPESPSAWLAPQLSLPHFLWPSSARPILFAAPPYSETLCLPGPGDWEPLGTGTARRPPVIPRKSMWNGRERVKWQAWTPPGLQLPAAGWNRIRMRATSLCLGPHLCLFSHNVHLSF